MHRKCIVAACHLFSAFTWSNIRRTRRSVPHDLGRDPPPSVSCEHHVNIEAFGSNYSLCLFLKEFREEPILEKSWSSLNITVFGAQNSSEDIPVSALTLRYATGYVIGN